MAHEWFVQHGGKQHGPLTSANLKKLADEGKIAPTTSVRLGSEGAWGPASRVQGLFATPSSATAPSPAPRRATSSSVPPFAPPVVPPPPPQALPISRVTPVGSSRKPAVPETPPIAPRILSAVALVLGILALATFWLPVLKGAMGWTGIVVGALGLVLGIVGLTLSALHKGTGLALGIAGTSSSLVGLVLTIVLGATFGLFGGSEEPKPILAAMPIIAPPTPAPELPPPEPKEEPKPEPVWTDARNPIEQGNVRARILAAKIESVRVESVDLSTLKRPKPQPMFKVRVEIENTTTDKIVQFPGWPGGGDLVGQGVSELLGSSELGKAVQTATAAAALTDNVGNRYTQVSSLTLAATPATLNRDISVRPGMSGQYDLVFQLPLPTIEYLRLELAPAGFGGEEPLRFQIARDMVEGLAPVSQ